MPYSNLLTRWNSIASDLKLDVQAPFFLELKNGVLAQALLLVRNFGAENGMCIFGDYEDVRSIEDELVQMGYGYSVLSSYSAEYDRDSTIRMLSEWGWSGDPECVPPWCVEMPEDDEVSA